MSLVTKMLSRLAKLPPAPHPQLRVERDLEVVMPDGAVLLADRWLPLTRADAPIVLMRSPYGRRGLDLFAQVLASRGYQVVVQSCRGSFGSGGEWEPFFAEAADGRATLSWLEQQPWFVPRVATFGPSYLGLTQWAIAADPPPWLRGMAIAVSSSAFRDLVYTDRIFSLDLALTWAYGLEHQEAGFLARQRATIRAERATTAATEVLPVRAADRALVGHPLSFYGDWVAHEPPSDDYWSRIDFSPARATMPEISMVGGWYDIFVRQQLADFTALRAAGRPARITIGPWQHSSFGGLRQMVEDAVRLYARVLDDQPDDQTARPVRVYVMGAHTWREFDSWPPPPDQQHTLHLASRGGLAEVPAAAGVTAFSYDPADPTPAVGGRSLNRRHAGPRDQSPRESRSDVLSFTSDPLTRPVTVIGSPTVRLALRTSGEFGDLVVRLCDVAGSRSLNICDGVAQLDPDAAVRDADGWSVVQLDLDPVAHSFVKGHRIRLQVSAGAHPLVVRNLGLGEPLATARRMTTNRYEVRHAGSALSLPVHDSAREIAGRRG